MPSEERISHEPNNPEAWICLCGNKPVGDGFFPCDASGNEVEPTPADWTTGCYACARCGRIIDQKSLAVVGRSVPPRADVATPA